MSEARERPAYLPDSTPSEPAPIGGLTDEFGPCIFCGREQTRNPHPHAGKPGHPDAGYMWHCVPCLEENRHRWAVRARRAESVITAALSLLDSFDPTSGVDRTRMFVSDLRNMLGAERV